MIKYWIIRKVFQVSQNHWYVDGSQFYRQDTGNGADFNGFEDLFGRFGSGFWRRATTLATSPGYRGEDQHASIQLDIEIAYHGTTQQITFTNSTPCFGGEPEVQRKTLEVKFPKA